MNREFFEKKRQERQEAKARVVEHIRRLLKALDHGHPEVLGVWELGNGEVVSVEALPDGTLRARRWGRQGGWEAWAKSATDLAPAEVFMEALDGALEPPID